MPARRCATGLTPVQPITSSWALSLYSRLLRRLLDEISEALLVVDRSGEVVLYNGPFERLAQLAPGSDLAPRDLGGALHAVLGGVEAQILAEPLPSRGASHTTFELPAGRAVDVATTPLTLEEPDDHLVVLLREVTEEQRRLSELEHRALHDQLTGLPNRDLILDRIQQALRRQVREARAVGVIFVDLDSFKAINDRYGHAVGDRVLVAVADRVRRAVRRADTVGRLGGDEFLIVCDGIADTTVLDAISARIEQVIAHPIELDDREITPRASVGAAFEQDPSADAERVVDRADELMYEAKRRGSADGSRRRVLPSTPARCDAGRWLQDAIETDQLWFAYLPVVALPSERVIAVEALVRSRHPRIADGSPQALLSLAEETGTTPRFTAWCLEAAAQAVHELRQASGHGVPIVLNLSKAQLEDESLASNTAEVAHRHGIPASVFSFDISESTIVAAERRLGDALQSLRSLECQLFADDVTGPVAAELAGELGFTGLKLDRRTIEEAAADSTAANAARALATRAHDLGLAALGEGVNDEHRLRAARALGCDGAQGYAFYGRPRPLSTLASLLG